MPPSPRLSEETIIHLTYLLRSARHTDLRLGQLISNALTARRLKDNQSEDEHPIGQHIFYIEDSDLIDVLQEYIDGDGQFCFGSG